MLALCGAAPFLVLWPKWTLPATCPGQGGSHLPPRWCCRHFGEAPSPCHGMCDVCQAAAAATKVAPAAAGAAAAAAQAAGPSSSAKAGEGGTQQRDVTAAAQGVLSTLANWAGAEKRATLTQLLDAWRKNKVGGGELGACMQAWGSGGVCVGRRAEQHSCSVPGADARGHCGSKWHPPA